MATDTHRLALILSGRDRGWSSETSNLVALALHPFDDVPVPMRDFENAVRKIVRKNSRSFRKASNVDAAQRATALLTSYRDLALQYGELYYSTRYDTALGVGAEHEAATETRCACPCGCGVSLYDRDGATVSLAISYQRLAEHVRRATTAYGALLGRGIITAKGENEIRNDLRRLMDVAARILDGLHVQGGEVGNHDDMVRRLVNPHPEVLLHTCETQGRIAMQIASELEEAVSNFRGF